MSPISPTGGDVVDWFIPQMLDLARRCMDYLFDNQGLNMRLDEERHFAREYQCYIGHPQFYPYNVRDHDHLNGKDSWAAQERCRRMARKRYKVAFFFHNFRGYDSHLIL